MVATTTPDTAYDDKSSSTVPARTRKRPTKPVLNTSESLKKGHIFTAENKANSPYTILLVGETGTGKSTMFQWMANVLAGNNIEQYDLGLLKKDNEAGGSQLHSQTLSAQLYELTSRNGMVVRILDTPGLADTRGPDQDEAHKANIAKTIKDNVSSVHAVVILTNGTQPRLSVSTEYALNVLSAIFPKSLVDNIGFIFTNVADPLHWNFSDDGLSKDLARAPRFLLDNPVAVLKKLNSLRNDAKPDTDDEDDDEDGDEDGDDDDDMWPIVENAERMALLMLVKLFDWLDTRQPQPTKEIWTLYEQSQSIESNITNIVCKMEQATKKEAEIEKLKKRLESGQVDINTWSKYEQTVRRPIMEQVPSSTHTTLCAERDCHSNCHLKCQLPFTTDVNKLRGCWAIDANDMCTQCRHPLKTHFHGTKKWESVIDTQVTVDHSMKNRWESAKGIQAQTEVALAAMKQSMAELERSKAEHSDSLARVLDEYSALSLGGSFVGQVRKTISLLKQKLEGLRNSGTKAEDIEKIEASMGALQRKLKALEPVEKRSALHRVKAVVTGRN